MKNNIIFLKKYWVIICLVVIILSSLFLMIFSSAQDSMVIDEKVHIPAGYLHVWQGNYLFNSEHPPLLNDLAGLFAKLAKPNVPVVPERFNGGDQWEYGDMFFYQSQNDVDKIIFWARFPFVLLTLGLIYLVFLWARILFGPKAGVIAAALTGFSPNILAHGRLATTDIGVVFFFILTCWCLRKYYLKPTWPNTIFLGASLGLVLLAKFSGLAILPVVFIGLVSCWIFKKPRFWRSLGQFFLILLIPVVLLWGVYAFSMREELIKMPQNYTLAKTLGSQTISPINLKWTLMPFDKFVRGYEILSDHNASGHWSYLNGQVDYNGWWYYFPLVLAYKMTLVEIALFSISLVVFWVIKKSQKLRLPAGGFDYFLVFFPPSLYLAVSMIGRIDIGIRHILLILPFIFIFSSSLILAKNSIFKKVILGLVLVEVAIGIWAFPNYIAYFNQIAGGAKGGANHLADSNLDWNQNMKRFGEYAKKNNITKVYALCWDSYSMDYYGVKNEILPSEPVNGVVVICAQQMKVPPDGFEFDWVKGPPDDIVANGIYVWRFDRK